MKDSPFSRRVSSFRIFPRGHGRKRYPGDDLAEHFEELVAWRDRCADVLKGNLPDERVLARLSYRYTCPAKERGVYLPQWLLDSCLQAQVWRWIDPDMAWEELLSLLTHQVITGIDRGMLPHMQHFAANDDVVNQELFRHAERSMLTQPPLLSIAALAVHRVAPNIRLLELLYDQSAAHHDWLDRRRDVDGDGLVAVIHPWETGRDADPRFHALMGLTHPSVEHLRIQANKRIAMVEDIFQYRCDAKALAKAGSFFVEEAGFNAIRRADLEAQEKIAEILEKRKEARLWRKRARRVKRAIQANMIRLDGDRLQVHDLVGLREIKNTPDTAAKFILLFGGCLTDEQAKQFVGELEGESGYSTPYRVPNTPIDHHYWNGREYWQSNVWIPINWLIYTGLRRYGFHKQARNLAKNSLDLVDRHGFCEFFDPITGRGGERLGEACPKNQSWTTLVLDMLCTEMSAIR